MNTTKPIYRLLRQEELKNLKQDFIYFLSSHSIDADAWQAIKNTDEVKALNYLALFSDFIFDHVLDRAEFLIHGTSQSVQLFHCLTKKIIRIEITSELDELDLTQLDLFDKSTYAANNKLNLKLYEKSNDPNQRKLRIFELMENGALISDGRLYKLVCLIMAEES
jgi:hypothetical protein